MVHEPFEGESPDDETLPYHDLCDRFESALRSGLNPQIEEYLKNTQGPDRSTALVQLVMIELQYLFDRGGSPEIEQYFSRFPGDHAAIEELLPYWKELKKAVEKSTSETRLAPPERMLGRFELYAKVGSGGFGEVWRAYDPRLKRTVAIKIMDPQTTTVSDLDMARHEASVAAQLNHPNIVSLHEFVDDDEATYLVSEYINGSDLRMFLQQGRVSQKMAVDICRQIARGLQHAHDQGIVHRDIKPGNILITHEEMPKLTDFGIARWSQADRTISDSRKMIGTVVYMSPEQVLCSKAKPESDVYSLGVVLFELLTGKPPFTGTPDKIMHGHRSVSAGFSAEDRKRIPRDLQTICLKALHKRVCDRYHSAAEFADDLDRFANGQPPKARRLNRLQRAWRRVLRRPVQTLVTLASMALFLSGLAFLNYEPPVDDGRREITIESTPVGAEVTVERRDDKTFVPQRSNADILMKTPGKLRLKPGHYRVSGYDRASGQVIQVDRFVPEVDDRVVRQGTRNLLWLMDGEDMKWPVIEIFPQGTPDSLVLIKGGTVRMVDPANPAAGEQDIHVTDFYISSREFSVEDLFKIRPELRKIPEIDYLLGYQGDDPLRPLFRDWALHWAEHYGCRLPSEVEYQYLMQQIKVPEGWQRSHGLRYENASWDYLPQYPAVEGVVTGLAEWTGSYPLSLSPENNEPTFIRTPKSWGVVWGGNVSAEDLKAIADPDHRFRLIANRFGQHRGLGFRLARSVFGREDDRND
ncbi:serine/threonine protein kinase [Rubinisphaera brasiliensis]|uniref:Serine/threonine protein kinase n=1 Tax=Rubinisphaera brasiliensis (strain ATCC 49424 / DSM 5305 / JCM 21570 / IAM 15109 / NBRC 103401 / IFAM 1448) TaxID=756272 RepID=F0SQT0_RUBBR|nr:serine/threonine-protein kinase [Rubinisphaera brasiliensis]ADY59110.1 serine/threonine protein kinase [Rubinisphaera brasiliensis DSM 5305]